MSRDTSFVAVLPVIDADLARACVKSMSDTLRARTLLIDNTDDALIASEHADVCRTMAVGFNLGVARSWNCGVAFARTQSADYLMLLSQAVEFGAPGGDDLLAEMHKRSPFIMLHGRHGWHCILIARAVFQKVGLFDPIFWPAYFEDTDFLYRMHLAGLPSPRENGGRLDQHEFDATDAGNGLMLTRRVVTLDYRGQERLYARKWGGTQGHEQFTCPYNDHRRTWRDVGPHT